MSNTKIFLGAMENRTRQLTVISNTVRLAGKNRAIMILPVPVDPLQENGGIVLYDFSIYKHIFNDMESFFPKPKEAIDSKNKTLQNLSKKLPSEQIGTYEVSVAADFNELKEYIARNSIEMNKYVLELLSAKYMHYFGFIICKIYKSAKFHPIGFSSPMILKDQYFVPTFFFDGSDFDMKQKWDHEIYATNRRRPPPYQAAPMGLFSEDTKISGKIFELKTRKISNRMPNGIALDKIHTMWRSDINTLFERNLNIIYRMFRIEENGNFKGI